MTIDRANKVKASVLKSPMIDEVRALLLYDIERETKEKKF